MKCKECRHEEPDKEKTIVIDGWAYDTETTQKGVLFKDIKYPKGAYLWETSDFAKITKELYEKLNLKDDWFFIKQPMLWQEDKSVARFGADSDRADFGCTRDPQYSDSSLGVRFKYKVKQ